MYLFLGKRLPLGLRAGVALNPRDLSASGGAYAACQAPAFVYVISAVGHQMVKIGASSDPIARLAGLQTASPFKLEIAYTAAVKSNNAFVVEQEAHQAMSLHRQAGEWFDVSVEDAVGAIEAASSKLGDPIAPVPPAMVQAVVNQAQREAVGPTKPPFLVQAAATVALCIIAVIGVLIATALMGQH